MIVLLGIVGFLFAFSSRKNAEREVSKPNVKFVGENNLYITNEAVSKLLIQNYGGTKNIAKEALVLSKLENALNANPMIKTAEVYMTVNGTLKAEIEQKTPIARVLVKKPYYIDSQGFYMPLSNNYSARVPLVTGDVKKEDLSSIFIVANKIKHDDFLKKNVIEIHQNTNNKIQLKLRQCNFVVELGSVDFLDRKISNLKAFYQKNKKDQTLNNYSKVNLQFKNQVVCTKNVSNGA